MFTTIRSTTLSMLALLALLLNLTATPVANAASAVEINAKVASTLKTFYSKVKYGKTLANKAQAILVFPEVFKAGIGIGGEYGEGAMLRKGKTVGYYNTAAASIGFQLGAQVKSQIIMFMTKDALKGFKSNDGWKAGVDGSVAVITVGAAADLDTNTIRDPIIGFIFSNKGLMYNLTFEGSKITRMEK
ncbi:hypothetical protein D8Y20_02195 [Mariprofundus sp. EBB-1]|nr:hypothetical protein D8Y20_02195 [Mariprofundus sp. EBB-1]